MSGTRQWLDRWVIGQLDLWVMTVGLGLALIPFGRSYVGTSYLGPVLLAIVAPAVVSLLTAHRSALVALASFVIVSLIVLVVAVYPHTTLYGLPGADTFNAIGHGLTSWWRDFLTGGVPSEPTADLLAAPVILGLLGSAATAQLTLRTRSLLAPALPPVVVFAVATAFSPNESMLSLITCCGFALAVLVALAARSAARREGATGALDLAGLGTTAWALTLGSLALAIAVGVLLGLTQGFIDDRDRFAARELIDPPIDLEDELSPLTLFRLKEDAERSDDELFTVTIDPVPSEAENKPLLIPLAYLTAYDGATWTVHVGEFRRAGTAIPTPDGSPRPDGEVITQRYTLPVNFPTSFVPSLPGAVALANDGFPIAYSEQTGTLLSASSESAGGSYEVTSRYAAADARPCPSGSEEPGSFGPELNPLLVIPAELQALDPYATLLRWTAPVPDDPLTRLRELECLLRADDGDYTNNPAARHGHSIARLNEVVAETKVGSDEQYASVIALAARMSSLPSRVAVGFELDRSSLQAGQTMPVTAEMVTAWPEVFVGGDVGWQRFDPSGEPERVADQTAAEVAAQPASGAPSPPPEETQDDDEPVVPEETEPIFREDPDDVSWLLPAVLGVLAALVLAAIVAGKYWLRARRRSVREPRHAIAGAWAETRTHLDQVGVSVGRCRTPTDVAALQHRAITDPVRDQLTDLGAAVDQALYSPVVPAGQLIDDAWALERGIWTEVRANVPLGRRAVGVLDPRPLVQELVATRGRAQGGG